MCVHYFQIVPFNKKCTAAHHCVGGHSTSNNSLLDSIKKNGSLGGKLPFYPVLSS